MTQAPDRTKAAATSARPLMATNAEVAAAHLKLLELRQARFHHITGLRAITGRYYITVVGFVATACAAFVKFGGTTIVTPEVVAYGGAVLAVLFLVGLAVLCYDAVALACASPVTNAMDVSREGARAFLEPAVFRAGNGEERRQPNCSRGDGTAEAEGVEEQGGERKQPTRPRIWKVLDEDLLFFTPTLIVVSVVGAGAISCFCGAPLLELPWSLVVGSVLFVALSVLLGILWHRIGSSYDGGNRGEGARAGNVRARPGESPAPSPSAAVAPSAPARELSGDVDAKDDPPGTEASVPTSAR